MQRDAMQFTLLDNQRANLTLKKLSDLKKSSEDLKAPNLGWEVTCFDLISYNA